MTDAEPKQLVVHDVMWDDFVSMVESKYPSLQIVKFHNSDEFDLETYLLVPKKI